MKILPLIAFFPLDSGHADFYGYVLNDPVNLIDPLGLLDPKGKWPFYTAKDYQQGVEAVRDGIIEKDPTISKEKATKIANEIAEKMTLWEAKKLNDLFEKGG